MVEQAKPKQPLDNALDFACKHAHRIQGLLVFVRDTCPNAIKLSAKKVAVTPKTKIKKVRFVEPLTSSSNIKHIESSTTSDSNTPVLSPTGLKYSTSNCGSKPTCNKKNDRISRTPTNVVPPKKTTSHSVKTQKLELKVYSKKPKNVKSVGSSKNAKIVESKNANHSESNHTWGSNATDIPSSSSLVMTVRFGNDHIARIMRFLRSKDDAPKAIIKCIKNIQVCLNATDHNVRTDNGTKFVNQILHEFYKNVGTMHQTFLAHTPQQNGIVERRNQTLVEAARTISGPGLHSMTPATSSSGLVPNTVSQQPQAAASRAVVLADSPVSTSIDQDAPSTSIPSTQELEHSPIFLKVQWIQHSSHGKQETTYFWYKVMFDDIIFSSTNTAMCNKFANQMTTKFKMSMMGKMSFFSGLKISQSPRGIFINQSKYASKIVKKYGMITSDSVDTPMVEKCKVDDDLHGKPVDATLYRGMIGSLMYLTSSSPDIIYAVCLCAQYQAKPTEKHLNAV
uniref:Retrovirus-related Pol polyprotein from transposon TNT 1-94 n=1 Tax=Tanacetum cinerariifolium TaxID=118510 RepID=A0A6L2NQS0_TANCI|nr:retrovirus-related Pol polyprotein from transposon TNT 1-94 [Tanacetum cinerariifolium]